MRALLGLQPCLITHANTKYSQLKRPRTDEQQEDNITTGRHVRFERRRARRFLATT